MNINTLALAAFLALVPLFAFAPLSALSALAQDEAPAEAPTEIAPPPATAPATTPPPVTPPPATRAPRGPVIPNFLDPADRFTRPDVSGLERLRFLTVTDFPPFSYIDADKQLVGFHVELARTICEELEVEAVCEIQALPFAELEAALGRGEGEAIMAGLAITPETRRRLDFTRPYFRLPARFLVRADTLVRADGAVDELLAVAFANRPVAVIDGTAHAAYLRRFFGAARVESHATRAAALKAVEEGRADALFDDALALSRVMQRRPGTFAFAGGPYLDPRYFGHGLAIATRPNDPGLTQALNHALVALNDSGRFEELYLRHFPIGLF